jgi:hypothetical protein
MGKERKERKKHTSTTTRMVVDPTAGKSVKGERQGQGFQFSVRLRSLRVFLALFTLFSHLKLYKVLGTFAIVCVCVGVFYIYFCFVVWWLIPLPEKASKGRDSSVRYFRDGCEDFSDRQDDSQQRTRSHHLQRHKHTHEQAHTRTHTRII